MDLTNRSGYSVMYRFLVEAIEWQISQRNQMKKRIKKAALISGLNYSIILGSACYVEGSIELGMKMMADVAVSQSNFDEFGQRLSNDLKKRISCYTGIDRANQIFELITGHKINMLIRDDKLWESIKMLFTFRNIIAHGRSLNFKSTINLDPFEYQDFSWDDNPSAKVVEDFFVKMGLMDKKPNPKPPSFLSDEIADYFWECAKDFVEKIGTSLEGTHGFVFSGMTQI